MYQENLQKIGLTDSEAEVYELLLTLGETKASKIVEKTALKRGVVYFVLASLEKKGLVIKTKRGKRVIFEAKHPTEILDYVSKKIGELQSNKSFFEGVLPALIESYNRSAKRPTVFYYDGLEGVKKVYEDTLKVGKEIYAILQSGEVGPEIMKWVRGNYIKKRVKLGISAKVIVAQDPKAERYLRESKEKLREVKAVPTKLFPIKMEVDVYGTKVGFISYHKDAPHFGVIIDSPYVADTLLALWKLAWFGARNYPQTRLATKVNSSKA